MGQSRMFEENLEVVQQPLEGDVLCGKNKECLEHPGSKAFRDIIEQFVTRYQQADSKYMKMEITKEIYQHLSEQSSRFLKYNADSGMWQELTSSAVRDKIGHALRFANRRKRNRKSRDINSASTHRRSNSETSSGYESSSSSSHSAGSLDASELLSRHGRLTTGQTMLNSPRVQVDDEFRPVTKLLQRFNMSLPSVPPPRPAVTPPMSPDIPLSSKPDKKLTDRDVLSIMNAPLIEFEPQTVKRIYEL